MIVTILLLLLVLGIMVLVHEFGHFAVAKLCGIRVEIFSIGFGKRILGFRSGDTDYRLSILPLGGYVKMAGDTPGEESTGDPGEFNAHPRWQRVLVAVAGPVANLILAFLIMVFVYMNHHEVDMYLSGPAVTDYTVPGSPAAHAGIQPGDRIVRFDTQDNPDWETILDRLMLNMNHTVDFSYIHNGKRVDTQILDNATEPGVKSTFFSIVHPLGLVPKAQSGPIDVGPVTSDGPASLAGIQQGDQIVAIDGLQLHSVEAILTYLHEQQGKPALLTVDRAGRTLTLAAVPKQLPGEDGTTDFRLGFQRKNLHPPYRVDKLALKPAIAESWKTNLKSAVLIRDVLEGMFARRVSPKSLSGPIGIGQQIGIAASRSRWEVFTLMAMISVNLAIFNLLPFPVLDGGLITLVGIEAIMRRDIDQQIKDRIYQVAFVCILLLAVMVFFNDISRLPHHFKL